MKRPILGFWPRVSNASLTSLFGPQQQQQQQQIQWQQLGVVVVVFWGCQAKRFHLISASLHLQLHLHTSHISLQPVSGVCWRGSASRHTGCDDPSPANVWRNACGSAAMRSASCAKASTIAWIPRAMVRATASSSRFPYPKWISIPVPIAVTRIY